MATRKSEANYHWVTFNEGDTHTITKVWNNGTEQTLDFNALPDVSIAYLLEYGARKRGADCHAGQSGNVQVAQEITARVFEDLRNGITHAGPVRLPAAVYAHALIDCGLTLTDDLALATGKVQAIMDDETATDDLKSIQNHPKVKQWLIENGYKSAPKTNKRWTPLF